MFSKGHFVIFINFTRQPNEPNFFGVLRNKWIETEYYVAESTTKYF